MAQGLVIGGGPAGLAAAEVMAGAGLSVTVADAMPSMGRKFLMAGKSGLNLTFEAPFDALMAAYSEGADALAPIIRDFDAQAVQDWARDLGQEVFTGSSGRVFPVVMKASPLLRAWFARLDALGVQRRTRWRWCGWDGEAAVFDTPEGRESLRPDVTVLALGGGSWRRLGSDGAWRDLLATAGVATEPFAPSNVGLVCSWSPHMERFFGTPVKGIAMSAGALASTGECVISRTGLEGGGIYPLTPALRAGEPLVFDLLPQRDVAWIAGKLRGGRAKDSLTNRLRKGVGLTPEKVALLREWGGVLPDAPEDLALLIKGLAVPHVAFRPLDEAISTAGGVAWDALDDQLMVKAKPGVFCAGEMVAWDAPTGGYLLTACLATGRWAGHAAARFAAQD